MDRGGRIGRSLNAWFGSAAEAFALFRAGQSARRRAVKGLHIPRGIGSSCAIVFLIGCGGTGFVVGGHYDALRRDQGPLQNIAGVSDRAVLRLGHAYAYAGQWDASRQAMETLINRYGNSPWRNAARYGIGWSYQNQRNYDGAYMGPIPLRRAVGDRGGEAVTLNGIGAVWSALGEKRKALAFYEQALNCDGERVHNARSSLPPAARETTTPATVSHRLPRERRSLRRRLRGCSAVPRKSTVVDPPCSW